MCISQKIAWVLKYFSFTSKIPGESVFAYNYNAAYIPEYDSSGNLVGKNLLVRCQQNTSSQYNPPNPYAVSPSVLSLASFTTSPLNASSPPFHFDVSSIESNSVVFQPETWYETDGTEDPRVIYRPSNQQYYLLYT